MLLTPENHDFKHGEIPVSPIMRCLPSGTSFEIPITIRLATWIRSKSTENSHKLELQVLSRENEETEWEEKQTIKHGHEDHIEFQINHFSDEGVVARDPATTSRAEFQYCNLLYVLHNDPTHNEDQCLVSWFVPRNEQAKNDNILARRNERLQLLPGGGNDVVLNTGETLKLFLNQQTEPNRERIVIR